MGRETAGGGLEMGTQQQGNQRSSGESAVFIGRASFRMSPVNQVEDHPEPLPDALLMNRPVSGNTGSRIMARPRPSTTVRSMAHQTTGDDTHGNLGQMAAASSVDLDWFNRGEDNLVLTPPRAGVDAAYDLLADDEFPRERGRSRSAPVWTLVAALAVGATITLSAQAVLRHPERMVDSVKQLVHGTQPTSEAGMIDRAVPRQSETSSPAPSPSVAPSKPSEAAVGVAPPSGAVATEAAPALVAPPAPGLGSASAPRPSPGVASAPASATAPPTAPTVVLSTALWAATEPRPPVRASVPAPGERLSRARLVRTAPARAAAVTPTTAVARRSGGDARREVGRDVWIDPFAGTDLEPVAPVKKAMPAKAADPKAPEQGSRLKMVSSVATPRHPSAPGSTSWVDPFAQ
jgi:hypothetical protein